MINKIIIKVSIAVTTLFVLGGCSIFPYEEDFACDAAKSYGRCVDVNGAYAMATTGEEHGYEITQDGEKPPEKNIKDEANNSPDKKINTKTDPYVNYRQSVYKKLQRMVDQPKTPMVKQPEVIRTLIANYQTRKAGSPLYMPRYVYFFGSEPEWVINVREPSNDDGKLLSITK